MADTGKPADRSAEAAKVADATVPDAPKRGPGRPPNAPDARLGPTDRRDVGNPSSDNDRVTSKEHPLSQEPVERVQHADRAVPHEQTTNPRPSPLAAKDRARFEELRSKEPNPNVLPPNVRTEDEEMEFRKLSKLVSDAERQAALEAARPETRPSPKQRLDELKGKGNLGEGETIEVRRLEEILSDEKRIEELKKMPKRVPEEEAELRMRQQRVAEARAAGGFDPNG